MYLSNHTGAEIDAMAAFQELTLTIQPGFAKSQFRCFEVGRTLVVTGAFFASTSFSGGAEAFRIPGKTLLQDTSTWAYDGTNWILVNFLKRNGYISVQVYAEQTVPAAATIDCLTATLVLDVEV